jgi:hypothetical protein
VDASGPLRHGALRVTGTVPVTMTAWGVEPSTLMLGSIMVGPVVTGKTRGPTTAPCKNTIMKDTTVKIGHGEVHYGDFYCKRSDNGQLLYDPLVGNATMDAFATEVGAEAIFQKRGFLAVAALTNGEVCGPILRASDHSPAFVGKVGFDTPLAPVRATTTCWRLPCRPSRPTSRRATSTRALPTRATPSW